MSKILRTYGLTFCAVNLMGIGIAFLLESRLGCDPIGLLCDGISQALSISFGMASFFYNSLIIGIALFAARKNLGVGTIAYGLLSGFFIDFYGILLKGLHLAERGPAAAAAFILGELCMAFAFALLIQLELGMAALDALLMKAQKHTKIPYAFIKAATDVLFVVMGTILGGVFGIGTVISAMVTGSLVTAFGKILQKNQRDF